MHCHLIVSRKDQSNKIKISPLTNHKNTKKGAIKGSFDRTNLFQQAETGFDKLFRYQRDLQETLYVLQHDEERQYNRQIADAGARIEGG